jgi:tetratricopeptide (TPR) repeat protein
VAALCVFGLAFLHRLIYLDHLKDLPFFNHPIMDASYHDTWAREIAGGGLMRSEPFFRAPLYSYALAFVYSVSEGSYLVPRIIQFILGGLTSAMVYLLGRRLMGRTAGIVAGLIAAVYPVLIYFDGDLLSESLFTFLCTLSLLLLDAAARGRNPGLWLWPGLSLGLALITRPTVGLFVPMALVGCIWLARRRALAALILLAGLVIPVAPVTLHNYAVSGEFIPVVWQGGLNLYLGNNPSANGWSATSAEIRKDWWGGYRDMIAIPRESLGREPGYNEVSAFWQGKAVDYMKTEPGSWARLMLKKVSLFWNAMEFPNNQDYNFMKLHSWVLRNPLVNFGVVAPLCLLGFFVLLPRRRNLYFAYAFLLSYFTGTVLFFVCSRYRAPALPAICLFAGGAIWVLAELVRRRRWGPLLLCLAGLSGAGLVVNLNLTGETLPDLAQSYTQVGKVYLELDRNVEAAGYFRKAAEVNPKWGEAYEQLGVVSMKQGLKEEAVKYLQKAVELQPEQATAFRALAMLYLSLGDLDSAESAAESAIRLAPYLEDSHNILGSVHREQGSLDQAKRLFIEELEIAPGNWRAQANLAGVLRSEGDLEGAAETYERAVALNPDDQGLLLALSGVYAEMGDEDRAGRIAGRASMGSADNIITRYNRAVILQDIGSLDEAGRLYEAILKEVPSHEGSLVNLGVIYAKSGKYAEALGMWNRALEVNPENLNARRNIRLLGPANDSSGR